MQSATKRCIPPRGKNELYLFHSKYSCTNVTSQKFPCGFSNPINSRASDVNMLHYSKISFKLTALLQMNNHDLMNFRVMAIKKPWHKACFKCNSCGVVLALGKEEPGKDGIYSVSFSPIQVFHIARNVIRFNLVFLAMDLAILLTLTPTVPMYILVHNPLTLCAHNHVEDAAAPASGKFCPQCGTQAKIDAAFCASCGNRFS